MVAAPRAAVSDAGVEFLCISGTLKRQLFGSFDDAGDAHPHLRRSFQKEDFLAARRVLQFYVVLPDLASVVQFQTGQLTHIETIGVRASHVDPVDALDRGHASDEMPREFLSGLQLDLVQVAETAGEADMVESASVRASAGRENVAVARAVDDLLCEDGVRAEFRLNEDPLHDRIAGFRVRIVVDDGIDRPGVEENFHIIFHEHFDEQIFVDLGIDGRISSEFAMADAVGERFETLHHFFAESLNDLDFRAVGIFGPVSENVDHETAGGQTAEVIVSFHDSCFHACAGRRDRRTASGRTAADDENVRFADGRDLSSRTRDFPVGECAGSRFRTRVFRAAFGDFFRDEICTDFFRAKTCSGSSCSKAKTNVFEPGTTGQFTQFHGRVS